MKACPHLPEIRGVWSADSMAAHRAERGEGYYLAALCYAQSLWQQDKPAQAILQLNKAWSALLTGEEPVLREWPPPYRALAWILHHCPADLFLGNPVRHFQHLASRMVGPNPEPRRWRAWACFHLSESCLDASRCPRDHIQIAAERLVIPARDTVRHQLDALGWPVEAVEWHAAMEDPVA